MKVYETTSIKVYQDGPTCFTIIVNDRLIQMRFEGGIYEAIKYTKSQAKEN